MSILLARPVFSGQEAVNKEKATKGAANALLAKVWAQRSDRDYTKVIHYCNEVINSPAGYALMPNYADLFDGSQYGNSESILEIAYIGGNWDVSNWGVELFLGLEDGWQKYCVPSKDLVAAYDNEGDTIRKAANIIFENNTYWADENWNPCGDNSIAVPFNYKQKHPDGWNSGDRPYLLRLADIILLKAEAQNETGDLGGAVTSLNQIRSRAGLPDATGSSKENLRTKILLERRLELAFEAHRWDDLIRLGVCTDVMNNLQEFQYTCEGGIQSAPIRIDYNVNHDKWLCPIPQLERDANPNLGQNPGY
ncbi:MAG: RagB/SusD family nutrient uptake outer membrane protein [Bacteroidia bacterium]|nr:RagB/SusD family nutrient uptake outer membrane protein [Bacteroidia bacterium]